MNGMSNERYRQLERDGGSLTLEERRRGWHFCEEFDGLLTDGEITNEEGVCVCGFDRRKVSET